jgi:hypothetical protein
MPEQNIEKVCRIFSSSYLRLPLTALNKIMRKFKSWQTKKKSTKAFFPVFAAFFCV